MTMPISLLLSWKTFFMLLGPATAFYTAPSISQVKLRLGATETNSAEWKDPPACDVGCYGRQEYWNNAYRLASQVGGVSDDPVSRSPSFSWYASWCDLAPFFTEVAPALSVSVLVPGVGTDAAAVDMYDAGYTSMDAFDYAPEGVDATRRLFGEKRLQPVGGATVEVADARGLPQYISGSYGAVMEKGTLDAVYLSGGKDQVKALVFVASAVSEMARLLAPRGIVFSVSAVATDRVREAFAREESTWKCLKDTDEELWITQEDGYTSNNVDGTMMVWERL